MKNITNILIFIKIKIQVNFTDLEENMDVVNLAYIKSIESNLKQKKLKTVEAKKTAEANIYVTYLNKESGRHVHLMATTRNIPKHLIRC